MAKLHRMVKLNDRYDTCVFTFLLPPSVATVTSQDIFSKEFNYGHHRWTLSTVRGDQHLGAYLAMANVYDGMTCSVDFTMTLLNNDHYTKNETYVERGAVFSSQNQRLGRKSFIALTDLAIRGFQLPIGGDGGGWFLLELELRNCKSSFEQVVEPSLDIKGSGGSRHPRYETSCFTFGNFDWTVVVHPNGDGGQTTTTGDGGHRIVFCLFRQTSFDLTNRIRYQVTLERAADRLLVRTDALDSLVDASGQCDAHVLSDDQSLRTASSMAGVKGQLKIRLDLLSCTTIAEVKLCPLNRSKNTAYLYDRDKQAWMMESDVSGDRLGLRLYYGDIRNIPRGHLRFVGWRVHVLPVYGQADGERDGEKKRKDKDTYFQYYTQTDVDEGFTMTTDISKTQLNENGSYLGGDGDQMTVQVEWLESQLLFHEKWQLVDNVVVQHKHQMWRELQALQAENYALEKQVHSYQVSIARNNAKWSSPVEGEQTTTTTNNGSIPVKNSE